MKRILFLLLLVLLPAFALTGCGSSKEDEDKQAKEQEDKKAEAEKANKKQPLPICPQVAIVRELSTLRDFGTEKPNPSQAVAAARMQSIHGDCGYPDKGGIDILFELKLIAQRGPRLGGNRDEFPFFIAVIDPHGDILEKNQMTTSFKFSGDPKKIEEKTESLHVFIPLPKDERQQGPHYQVLVGFQLTQTQLDAVRTHEAEQMHETLLAPPPPPEPKAEPPAEPAPAAASDKKDETPYPVDNTHFLKLPEGATETPAPAAQTDPEPVRPPMPPDGAPAAADQTPSSAPVDQQEQTVPLSSSPPSPDQPSK